ncbi:MAG: plastocyanin/azurin family copper-binding protein [Actinomycetes bacterium]
MTSIPAPARTVRLRRGVVSAAVALMTATLVVGASPVGATVHRAAAAPVVEVGDNFYKPLDLKVTAGTKITWVNKGNILHSVTPNKRYKPKKGKAFGIGSMSPKKSYSYTFTKPGTYAYYCSFHGAPGSGQHATITVEAAATVTTTTSTP